MRRTIATGEIGPLCGKARKTGWGWIALPGFPNPVGTEPRGCNPAATVYDLAEVKKWLKSNGKWDMKPRWVNQPKRSGTQSESSQKTDIKQFLTAPSPLRLRMRPTGNAKTVRVRIDGDNGPMR
jgi:hypothetical protein